MRVRRSMVGKERGRQRGYVKDSEGDFTEEVWLVKTKVMTYLVPSFRLFLLNMKTETSKVITLNSTK